MSETIEGEVLETPVMREYFFGVFSTGKGDWFAVPGPNASQKEAEEALAWRIELGYETRVIRVLLPMKENP